MNTADRLRAALAHRAETIEPSPDALDRIEETLMTSPRFSQSQRWILGGVAAAVLLVAGIVFVTNSGGDDDDSGVATGTSTSTTATSTSTSSSTTTTEAFPPAVDPYGVAFPSPDTSRRFDGPQPAARAYATDVLGFTDPDLIVVEYRQGDSRSGEVVVTDREDGPETIIAVRQMDDDHWYALASETTDINVDMPAAGNSLASPFETNGTALAFEGTVDVVVVAQADLAQRGSGFVTGSGVPPAGPFSGSIFFSSTADTPGVLVYRTLSAEDGHVVQATSFPVRLTDEELPTAPDECGDTADDDGSGTGDGDGEAPKVVKVFFECTFDDETVPLRRTVPADEPAILTATLAHLLAGPTDAEQAAGFTSPFLGTNASLLDVVISEATATIDIEAVLADDLANSSANIVAVRTELFRTATQYSTVESVEVLLGGSCDAFATWSQSDDCLVTTVP